MNTSAVQWIECPHAGHTPGMHRMAYHGWGDPHHPHVIVCVHGISRQGLDFEVLAGALVGAAGQRCRVVSVDVVGRGMSDWLVDPSLYHIGQYVSDLLRLLQALKAQGAQTLDWVGTSMGGLIGIALAAQTQQSPEPEVCRTWGVDSENRLERGQFLPDLPPTTPKSDRLLALRKMVLNDVGPALQWSALERIGSYLGADRRFASEAQAQEVLRELYSSFGPHTPEQWQALCKPMIRACEGGFRLHYDPAIAQVVRQGSRESAQQAQQIMWQLYDALRCQILLIRGAKSDLLSRDTARQMSERGPRAQWVEFADVGHAPTLVQADQVHAVQSFLFA